MKHRIRRAGFSLMEVLLATAILLASVMVLMELAGIGRYYVQSVEARSAAQALCLTKLNELLSGAQPLQTIDERTIEDQPDWVYSVEITPVRQLPLAAVRVTVTQQVTEGPHPLVRGKPKSCSLVRWVADQRSPRAARDDAARDDAARAATDAAGPSALPLLP